MQLLQASVRGKGFRLNFVFVCLFIKTKTISSDWSIHSRAKRSILFDYIALSTLDFNVFPSLVHFAENLDTVSLNLSQCSFLVLGFLETNFFGALGMLFLCLFLSFNQCTLKQIQTIILVSLNVIFPFLPVTNLSFNDELTTQIKASFVWSWRQSLFKGSFLTHLVN